MCVLHLAKRVRVCDRLALSDFTHTGATLGGWVEWRENQISQISRVCVCGCNCCGLQEGTRKGGWNFPRGSFLHFAGERLLIHDFLCVFVSNGWSVSIKGGWNLIFGSKWAGIVRLNWYKDRFWFWVGWGGWDFSSLDVNVWQANEAKNYKRRIELKLIIKFGIFKFISNL